ncbi:hypothetical protein ACNOYE_39025 [Nannocystaceae bacterium ST9]
MLPMAACTSDDEDGDDELGETDGDATDGDSTDGDSTEGDATEGDATEGTSTEGTSTDADSTEDDTTDTTDTDTTDTGTTGDPSLNEALCTQLCALYGECSAELPGCLEACIDGYDTLQAECLGVEQALTGCVGELTCDELFAYFDGAEPYPCQAEQAAAQACEEQEGGCEWSGGARGAVDCSFEYICPNEPVHAVECNAEGCTCLEDGVEVGGCSEVVEFCATGDDQAANACCGWQL